MNYVYNYATSATYSAILAQRIFRRKDGELESYKKFLGGSAKPLSEIDKHIKI